MNIHNIFTVVTVSQCAIVQYCDLHWHCSTFISYHLFPEFYIFSNWNSVFPTFSLLLLSLQPLLLYFFSMGIWSGSSPSRIAQLLSFRAWHLWGSYMPWLVSEFPFFFKPGQYSATLKFFSCLWNFKRRNHMSTPCLQVVSFINICCTLYTALVASGRVRVETLTEKGLVIY